jgi:hypothetical protein
MKATVFCTLICLLYFLEGYSQTYSMVESHISFYSSAPVEEIEAVSTQSRSLFEANGGNIAIVIPINSFAFDKKLMQEHFNEKFMESHLYPEATFTGTFSGYEPHKTGPQQVKARGKLMIHGVTRPLETVGTLEFKGDQVFMDASFPLRVSEFDIEIPKLLFYNIAEEVEVRVKGSFKIHEK